MRGARAQHRGKALNRLLTGGLAGVIGTTALNLTTNADLAIRGRKPSSVPSDTIRRAEAAVGIDLADLGGARAAHNRREGLAVIGGYLTGAATGALYGLVRERVPTAPRTLTGLGVGIAAMVAANGGAVAARATRPSRWTLDDWLTDIVPHAIFGVTTVVSFDRLIPPGEE